MNEYHDAISLLLNKRGFCRTFLTCIYRPCKGNQLSCIEYLKGLRIDTGDGA